MWRLSGTLACWKSARWETQLDVSRPALGLTHFSWLGVPLRDASLWQIFLPSLSDTALRLEECYVRGEDLIARFGAVGDAGMYPEIYWRMTELPANAKSVMIELLVSVRTALLDSDPRVMIQSVLPAASFRVWPAPQGVEQAQDSAPCALQRELAVSEKGCVVVASFEDEKLEDEKLVFAQLVDPADLAEVEVSCEGSPPRLTSVISCFSGRLEKGVIRRARLRAVITSERDADSVWIDQWKSLVSAPPPLTT